MYRFRDNVSGVTHVSRESVDKHLHKIGIVRSIRGYTYGGKHGPDQAVLVKGDLGTMRLSGLSWGYGGEGPAGLRYVLAKIGVSNNEIDRVLRTSWDDSDKIGTKWLVEMEYPIIGHA